MHKGTSINALSTGEIPGIDPNVKTLVAELNKIPGLQTTGSCGGHPSPLIYQCPQGEFLITISIEWDADGTLSLERLVWATFAGPLRGFGKITAHSAPPYLNYPRKTLYFAWDGIGDPQQAAQVFKQCFEAERPHKTSKIRKQYIAQPELPEDVLKIVEWLDEFPGITPLKWDPEMEKTLNCTAPEPIRLIVFETGVSESGRHSLEFITWVTQSAVQGSLTVLVPQRQDPWEEKEVYRPKTIFAIVVTQAESNDIADELAKVTFQHFQ
jgi:hypothetical protein